MEDGLHRLGLRPFVLGDVVLDHVLERLAVLLLDARLDLLEHAANHIEGHTICALGEAAAWPVQSVLKKWRHEFVEAVQKQSEKAG